MRFTRFSSFTDINVYSILPECLLQIGNQILRCLNAYGQAQQPVIQPGALQQVFWHAFVCLVERVGNQAFYASQAFRKGNQLHLAQNAPGEVAIPDLEGNHGSVA